MVIRVGRCRSVIILVINKLDFRFYSRVLLSLLLSSLNTVVNLIKCKRGYWTAGFTHSTRLHALKTTPTTTKQLARPRLSCNEHCWTLVSGQVVVVAETTTYPLTRVQQCALQLSLGTSTETRHMHHIPSKKLLVQLEFLCDVPGATSLVFITAGYVVYGASTNQSKTRVFPEWKR